MKALATVVGLVCVAIAGYVVLTLVMQSVVVPSASAQTVTAWDYETISVSGEPNFSPFSGEREEIEGQFVSVGNGTRLEAVLDFYGAQGWELVDFDFTEGTVRAVLRRPVQ